MKAPICMNCVHCIGNEEAGYPRTYFGSPWCRLTKTIIVMESLVYGDKSTISFKPCDDEREEGKCGRKGRNFQPKP